MTGYHTKEIKKGVVGEASKIVEEVEEFMDAVQQDASIMALFELTDLYGAIREYLIRHHPGTTMADLEKQADITKRVFVNGHRRP